ncbi:Protein of unknown function [Frankineae bacterium MT45]|nr:Protein of unknown function [Frankineae bacterium MT45]
MAGIVEKATWRAITGVIAIPVGIAVSKSIAQVWLTARPDNPPRRPTDPNVSWGDAAGWAALSAVGVAVGQLITTKGATTVWRGLTGEEPPPLREKIQTSARRQSRLTRRISTRADRSLEQSLL